MVSEGFQSLEPIARILHLALDIAEHINKLLLASVVVLALDATQIFALLGCCLLFDSATKQRLSMLVLVPIERCKILARKAGARGAHHHLTSALGNVRSSLTATLGRRCRTPVLTGSIIYLLEQISFGRHIGFVVSRQF